EIRAGNTFQCVIGFKTEYQIQGEPLKIYERLRKINPSPHMYFLKFGAKKIIGASPELLFRVRERELETFPLAGTAARGKTAAEDQKLARELLNNPKEIAEHNMLVDLHRNDLGRVSRFGTVKVRRLCDIKRFSHVQHISSEITGIMAPGEDMFSALASNFPAGTLTGAPKIESIKIIDRLEPDGRGPYGGALGHFGWNGDATFAIPIRSLFIDGDYAFMQNGSGIVYDSTAENEYQEIKRKGEAIEKIMS
ncbi:MAG TPA: anthranilate synthase component I, partial [Candidatus Jacksonbacteria bacterium]|nr:anthranilate synthase component I [Candidatus Jacksonbacteria bacterium]